MPPLQQSGSTLTSYAQPVAQASNTSPSRPETSLDELKIAARTLIAIISEIEGSDDVRRIKFTLTVFSNTICNPSMPRNISDFRGLAKCFNNLQPLFGGIRMGTVEEAGLACSLGDLEKELQMLAQGISDAFSGGNLTRFVNNSLGRSIKKLDAVIRELPSIPQTSVGVTEDDSQVRVLDTQAEGIPVQEVVWSGHSSQVRQLEVNFGGATIDTEGGGIVNYATGICKLDISNGKINTRGGDIGCHISAFPGPANFSRHT